MTCAKERTWLPIVYAGAARRLAAQGMHCGAPAPERHPSLARVLLNTDTLTFVAPRTPPTSRPRMTHRPPRHVLSSLALVLVALAASGCVRRYSQPSAEEPHADVQIRVVHHATLGTNVEEMVTINGEAVSLSEGGGGVRQGTMRVRPEGLQYGFETEFYHFITTQEWRTYNETQRYQCGYNRSGPTYCTRSIPRQRLVTVTHRISDGGCGSALNQIPLAGGVYLVQYEFAGVGQCQATCQRLVQGPDGQTQATACGATEPPPASPFPPSAGYVSEVVPAGQVSGTSGGEVIIQ